MENDNKYEDGTDEDDYFVQAEKMAKKADAWKEYKEAAMVDMMLQTLPKVI